MNCKHVHHPTALEPEKYVAMDSFGRSSCYSDLSVTVQEGKKRNEEVLQMLANCEYYRNS